MPSRPLEVYSRTQRGPLSILLIISAAVFALFAGTAAGDAPEFVVPLLFGMAILFVLLAGATHSLTVRVNDHRVEARFGPIPLFRRRVPLAEIEEAAGGRSTLIDGLGIHYVPRRGWTWNVWGWDCVELRLRGKRTWRIGTEDPAGLAAAITERIPSDSGENSTPSA